MLDPLQCWLTILYLDSRELSPVYGAKRHGRYEFDLSNWLERLKTSVRDLAFVQALLAAQGDPKRYPVLGSLRRQLSGFSGAVYAILASVMDASPGFTPTGAVTLLTDLQDPTKGLNESQYRILSQVLDRTIDSFEQQPALLGALAELLRTTAKRRMPDVAGAGTCLSFSLGELADAGAGTTLPAFDTVKLSQREPPTLSVSDEALMLLSGHRRGVVVLGPYYALVVPEIAADVLLGVERTPYLNWRMVEAYLAGDHTLADFVPGLVEGKLRSWFNPAKPSTAEKLHEKLAAARPDLAKDATVVFVRRELIVACLDAGVVAPDRRGYATPIPVFDPAAPKPIKPRKTPEVIRLTLPCGVALTFQRGQFYYIVDTLPGVTSAYVTSHSYAAERAHVFGTDLILVRALERIAATMDAHFVTRLRLETDEVVAPVKAGRLTFHELKRQRETVARRAAGVRTHQLLAFSVTQDALIAERWRPYSRADVRADLENLMPEHSWKRICARGRLIAAVINAGGTLADLGDEGRIVGLLGPDSLDRHAGALGGGAREKELVT